MIRLLIGDCRERLRELPDESVHCVVTSPPYFGLRDYGTAMWEGGDVGCDHIQQKRDPVIKSSSTLGFPADGGPRRIADGNTHHEAFKQQFRSVCAKCGARRIDSQIGLEPTPDAFVAEMVAVFREVRRVLRADGTCWLNLGDSYAANGAKAVGNNPSTKSTLTTNGGKGPKPGDKYAANHGGAVIPIEHGLKPKDLIGIPWRVAFALQADGWWLRQDIIWHKPNPMPESVRDRCTKAHEYIFLLSKSERYFYDADAISEPASYPEGSGNSANNRYIAAAQTDPRMATKAGLANIGARETRNRRSVWTITTQPFSEAHFATFPPELPELCIKAGCPVGGTVLDPFGGACTTGLTGSAATPS
jgi:DNA modification methylase